MDDYVHTDMHASVFMHKSLWEHMHTRKGNVWKPPLIGRLSELHDCFEHVHPVIPNIPTSMLIDSAAGGRLHPAAPAAAPSDSFTEPPLKRGMVTFADAPDPQLATIGASQALSPVVHATGDDPLSHTPVTESHSPAPHWDDRGQPGHAVMASPGTHCHLTGSTGALSQPDGIPAIIKALVFSPHEASQLSIPQLQELWDAATARGLLSESLADTLRNAAAIPPACSKP